MRRPIFRYGHRGRLDENVSMSEMFFAASREFSLLRTVRLEHGSEVRVVRVLISDFTSAASRAHLPSLRWSLSTKHSILRTMRSEHGLAPSLTKFDSSAYNVSNQRRSPTPLDH